MGIVILVAGAVAVFFLLNQKPPEQFDPLKDLLGEVKKVAPVVGRAASQVPRAIGKTPQMVAKGATSIVKSVTDLF